MSVMNFLCVMFCFLSLFQGGACPKGNWLLYDFDGGAGLRWSFSWESAFNEAGEGAYGGSSYSPLGWLRCLGRLEGSEVLPGLR